MSNNLTLGFIYKDFKKGPVYTGQDIADTLSISDALSFQKSNPTLSVYTLPDLYGAPFEFQFPEPDSTHINPDKDTNITSQVYDQILNLSNLGQVNDYVVGLRSALTKNYDILQTASTKQRYLRKSEHTSSSYPQAPIILAKDALLGLYNPDPLVYQNTPIPISTDYELPDPRYISSSEEVSPESRNAAQPTLTFKYNFSAGLRNALLSRMLKSWNEDPKNINFQRSTLLQSRQIDALKRLEHRTVILAPRRCVHEDSRILLADGSTIKAKDLTTEHVLYNNKRVISVHHQKADCIEMTFKNGSTLIISKNHRIPTNFNWNDETKTFNNDEQSYITYNSLKEKGAKRDLYSYAYPTVNLKDTERHRDMDFTKLETCYEVGEQNTVEIEVDGDRTFVANGMRTHNSGKSLFMALLALTQLMSYNHKKGVRPRTILYLSKDTATYKTVLDYIQATVDNVEFLKEFFYYNSKDAIFYFRDPDTKNVYGQIKFLTAEGRTPGVGSAADRVFIDEAMLIKESIFKRIEPICTHEGAGLTVVSTFYDHLEDGDRVYDRPIRLCNEYEKTSSKIQDIDTHILKQYDNLIKHGERPPQSEAGLRYTIDNVDVITNKERIKELYSQDFDVYMKELYCRAPQKKTLFNFRPHIVTARKDTNSSNSSYIINETTTQPNRWDLTLVCYDPARTGDMSALTTIGYSKVRRKIQVLKEQQLNFVDKSSFLTQVPQIQEALKRAKDHSHTHQFVMDGSHPGVQDVLIANNIIPFRSYKWCGGQQQKKGKNPFEFNTPKILMIEALQFLLDNAYVEIRDHCPITIDQLDKYIEIVNPHTNQSKFEGAHSTHDDFVASLLVGAWTLYDAYDFRYRLPTSDLSKHTTPGLPNNKTNNNNNPLKLSKTNLSFNFLY